VTRLRRTSVALLNSVWPTNDVRLRLLRFSGAVVGDDTVIAGELRLLGDAPLRIGTGVFVNVGCFFDLSAALSIGDRAALGPHVRVLTSTHDIDDPSVRAGVRRLAPVSIGAGCWIGAGAVILPGLEVGEGAVVGAGSVVTRSVEPHVVVAGVPARRLRRLTNP
jgi:maltose O-acetyltransferase